MCRCLLIVPIPILDGGHGLRLKVWHPFFQTVEALRGPQGGEVTATAEGRRGRDQRGQGLGHIVIFIVQFKGDQFCCVSDRVLFSRILCIERMLHYSSAIWLLDAHLWCVYLRCTMKMRGRRMSLVKSICWLILLETSARCQLWWRPSHICKWSRHILLFLWLLLFLIHQLLCKSSPNWYIIFDLAHQLMKGVKFDTWLMVRHHIDHRLIAFFIFLVDYIIRLLFDLGYCLSTLTTLWWWFKERGIRCFSVLINHVSERFGRLFRYNSNISTFIALFQIVKIELIRCIFNGCLLFHIP